MLAQTPAVDGTLFAYGIVQPGDQCHAPIHHNSAAGRDTTGEGVKPNPAGIDEVACARSLPSTELRRDWAVVELAENGSQRIFDRRRPDRSRMSGNTSPLERGLPGSHRVNHHTDGLDDDWGVVDHDVVS
jgi:hypothetical protein